MTIRLSLAATALLGLAAFASPALAIEQIHIPDSSAAQNSGPPDALFDKSVPTTWQSKQNQQQSNGLGSFHFSAGAGNNPYSDEQRQYSTGFQGENAAAPGSEFHNNGVPLDPYYAPPPR
ncbi:MAG TPA: hypothetical protein VMU22_05260 [Rhizomicrobium sp.]|nr:hypothetical protein [Rhizomicrobium sp.]